MFVCVCVWGGVGMCVGGCVNQTLTLVVVTLNFITPFVPSPFLLSHFTLATLFLVHTLLSLVLWPDPTQLTRGEGGLGMSQVQILGLALELPMKSQSGEWHLL